MMTKAVILPVQGSQPFFAAMILLSVGRCLSISAATVSSTVSAASSVEPAISRCHDSSLRRALPVNLRHHRLLHRRRLSTPEFI